MKRKGKPEEESAVGNKVVFAFKGRYRTRVEHIIRVLTDPLWCRATLDLRGNDLVATLGSAEITFNKLSNAAAALILIEAARRTKKEKRVQAQEANGPAGPCRLPA